MGDRKGTLGGGIDEKNGKGPSKKASRKKNTSVENRYDLNRSKSAKALGERTHRKQTTTNPSND